MHDKVKGVQLNAHYVVEKHLYVCYCIVLQSNSCVTVLQWKGPWSMYIHKYAGIPGFIHKLDSQVEISSRVKALLGVISSIG